MDEIELMVAETFKHFNEHYVQNEEDIIPPTVVEEKEASDELPASPGLLYHIQKTTSIFVIRTLVSDNIRDDYKKVLDNPEEYPSLRLIEGGEENVEKKLRCFILDDRAQAEIIHDQVCNRRFPINEELMCNLSDPGFSWWMTKKNDGFQISFTLSSSDESTVKLGPIGDQQLALKSFQQMSSLFTQAGLELNIQNEVNRVQFDDGEEFLMEELKDLFQYGVMGEGMTHIFKLLARRIGDHSQLETMWFYFLEVAAMRRFWIQIQYDID